MTTKSNTTFEKVLEAIINEQKEVIGPIALQQAGTIEGIKVDGQSVVIVGKDPKKVLENLVKSYAELFGRASIELSKEAVHEVPGVSDDSLPEVLR